MACCGDCGTAALVKSCYRLSSACSVPISSSLFLATWLTFPPTASFRFLRGLLPLLPWGRRLSSCHQGRAMAQTWVGIHSMGGGLAPRCLSNTWAPRDSCRTGRHHAGRRVTLPPRPPSIFLCLWSPREQALGSHPAHVCLFPEIPLSRQLSILGSSPLAGSRVGAT